MPSHMAVQAFATERNSQAEFLVQFILEEFCLARKLSGQLKDGSVTTQKLYTSNIASDVWDHFVQITRSNGRQIELWCQTTCYKGNDAGVPEPNKTYEVRESLTEGLSIRQHFSSSLLNDCRSIHFTVGDSKYCYPWFFDLKSAVYDLSIHIGDSQGDIFAVLSSEISRANTEDAKRAILKSHIGSRSLLGRQIQHSLSQLNYWWDNDIAQSNLAIKQWNLIEERIRSYSGRWPDLTNIRGEDIKGRTNRAVFSEEPNLSDSIIMSTAQKLLSKKPFLSASLQILADWPGFCSHIEAVAASSEDLSKLINNLWQAPLPDRLVIRRLLLRIHSSEAIHYIQDRGISGITEHTVYSGSHSDAQTQLLRNQILVSFRDNNVKTKEQLVALVRQNGRQIINQARWFEAKNGTQLKPSFDYVETMLINAGFGVVTPTTAGISATGYHADLSDETVRPYTNLKVVVSPSGRPLCVLKAKFFREHEFARRCKEEAFVGLTLKYQYRAHQFKPRLTIPLCMFIDMAEDCSPPPHAVRRLISFGWDVFFSTTCLLEFLRR